MTAPTASGTALLVLDMISDYRYPGGDAVLGAASRIAPAIASLKRRMRKLGIPTIYVNDTRGRWESDQSTFLRRCLRGPPRAARIIELLLPDSRDYFIFKPRHSAFFATPLHELLSGLDIDTLILTGMTSHQCVLFTAIDAHVRKLNVIAPRDCIGAPSAAQTRHALFILEHSVGARTVPGQRLRLAARRPRRRR
ncbi:MAG TPA: isochorismatase family cysteine hydrolase [Povalibacter sp.]|nr:isochorismatase family cysteine hydrolase [Povalibacter sp.]